MALAVFVAALLIYGGTALATQREPAPQHAYFNHLAEAFLSGRLDLIDPPGHHDLTPHDGRWYLAFPPLPAVLMLPGVAAVGLARFHVVWFSVALASANVMLVWMVLASLARRGWIGLGPGGRAWLSALFALSTAHWQAAPDGNVWFLGHICTLTFAAAAALAASRSASPWPAGLLLAIAIWGRPNVLFMWPLLAGLSLTCGAREDAFPDVRRLRRWMLCSALPLAASAAGLLWYNAARFDSALDFGYTRQQVDTSLLGPLHEYGQFSPHHAMRNLRVMLLGLPTWPAGATLPVPDDQGMSLLLTTPALLYLVRLRRDDVVTRAAWLSVLLLLVPLVLYYNTGWRQFGYRFSLDFIMPLLVLLAAAAGRRVTWPLRLLIAAGVVVNAWGLAWWFCGADACAP